MKKHVTVKYDVHTNKLGREWEGYRIIMLSDFHNNSYGVDEAAVLADVRRAEPDLVLIAGDIYTGKAGLDNKNAKHFIRELSVNYPVYFGIGNHEQRMEAYPEKYGDMYKCFTTHLEQCGVRLLLNSSVQIKRGDTRMTVTGLRIDDRFYRKFKRVKMPEGYMRETLGEPDREGFQVLIAHTPVYFSQYARWGADLILSGHLHGGMAKLPGVGGIIAPNYRLFPKYDSGMYQEYSTTMILGAGIGTHTINLRPFNPPEIVQITIHTCNME